MRYLDVTRWVPQRESTHSFDLQAMFIQPWRLLVAFCCQHTPRTLIYLAVHLLPRAFPTELLQPQGVLLQGLFLAYNGKSFLVF